MIETVILVVQVALGIGGLVALVRVIRGPSLADRIIGLDLLLLLLAGGVATTGHPEEDLLVPVLIVVTLIAFAGTIIVARFIEWRDTE
ncbi:MAG: cation:proton antiporter [Acidimicrobiia bacterium]|nr:MAG: cation:proton antiporter [Acidimicrobiia bacterium]